MKKKMLVLFLCGLTYGLMAQEKGRFGFRIETQSGYEYNVFNSNAQRQIVMDGKTVSALQSGFFQHLDTRVEWKKKWKKRHDITTRLRARYDLFPKISDANVLRPELYVAYNYRLKKGVRLFAKGRYTDYRTNRPADETGVLPVAASYKRWGTDLGISWKPMKNNTTKVQVETLEKRYADRVARKLRYRYLALDVETKQRIKKKGRPSDYLTFTANTTRRWYKDEVLQSDNVLKNIPRQWQYYTISLAYKHQPSKKMYITPKLTYQRRKDVSQNRFSYQQYAADVKMGLKSKTWDMAWSVGTFYRPFSELLSIKNSTNKLKHTYLRSSVWFTYALHENWKISAKARYFGRWRNDNQLATTYLPYTNFLIGAGVRYEL